MSNRRARLLQWIGIVMLLVGVVGIGLAPWSPQQWASWTGYLIAALLLIGAGSIAWGGLETLRTATEGAESEKSTEAQRHILGVGLVMWVAAGAGLVATAGLVTHGLLPWAADVPAEWETGRQVLVGGGMSFVGALFFVTNRLWRFRYPEEQGKGEDFDRGRFWAGLAFRTGEALLFTLVLVLVATVYSDMKPSWFPLAGLVLGMFVKSGERLVYGIAQRVFAAARSFVPADRDNV